MEMAARMTSKGQITILGSPDALGLATGDLVYFRVRDDAAGEGLTSRPAGSIDVPVEARARLG
jgi:bifunctional DNA-binding transcriptional regulator/antitoxin component of YhaV-PrlF toxin-antitoxin module